MLAVNRKFTSNALLEMISDPNPGDKLTWFTDGGNVLSRYGIIMNPDTGVLTG
jgi:hypothetical protein